MSGARAASLMLVVLALAGMLPAWPVHARVFPGIGYGLSGDPGDGRRIDMHTPDTPGPHPVVAMLGAAGEEAAARRLAASGHVVALVSLRDDSSHADLVTALVWLWRHAGSYAGDANRLHLVAIGDSAGAALNVAGNLRPLDAAGMATTALRGVALIGWAADTLPELAADPTPPPLLLVPDPAPVAQSLGAVRIAERWRAQGAAAEVVRALPGVSAREPLDDIVLAWLPTVAIARSPRFETLRFAAHEPHVAGAAPVALAQAAGCLLLASSGARLSVASRMGPAAAWTQELDAGLGRVLWMGNTDPAAAQGQVVLLAEQGGSVNLWQRDPRTRRWGAPLLLTAGVADASAAWAAVQVDPRSGARILLVAIDAGERSILLRVIDGQRTAVEVVPTGQRISGLVVDGGVAYAAVFGHDGGRILRRVSGPIGVWTTAAAWAASRGPLGGLAALSPGESGLLGVLGNGEAVRVDPERGVVHVEADLGAAFASNWGALAAGKLALSTAGFTAMLQPFSGDRVHLAGLAVAPATAPAQAGWFLVRQAGGHYAYGRAGTAQRSGDAAQVVALLPSPFAADAGGALFALTGGALPTLLRGELPQPSVAQGFWADRTQEGRGLVLQRAGDAWLALVYTRDVQGAPRWYSASGSIEDGRWQPTQALLRYRRDPVAGGLGSEAAGSIALRFGADADDPSCAGAPRDGASALAVLDLLIDGTPVTDCIEPQRDPGSVRPAIDGSGIWTTVDGSWGVALESRIGSREGAERALLFHFGTDGMPRWVLGTGVRREGSAALVVRAPDRPAAAGRVGYRFAGACGYVGGSASVAVPLETEGSELLRLDVPLVRAAGGACY